MHTDPIAIKKSPFHFIKLVILIEFVSALLPWLLSIWLDARRAYESTPLADSLSHSLLTALVVTFLQVAVRPAGEHAYLTHKGTETFDIRAGNGSQALSVSKATQYIRFRFRSVPV
jgi:hypothetical protein